MMEQPSIPYKPTGYCRHCQLALWWNEPGIHNKCRADELEAENTKLKDHIQARQLAFQAELERVREQRDRWRKLAEQCLKPVPPIREVNDVVNALQAELSDMERQRDFEVRAKISRQQTIADLESELAEARAQLERLKEALKAKGTLHYQAWEWKEKIDSLEAELERYKEGHQNLRVKNIRIKRDNRDLKAQLDREKQASADLREAIERERED